MTILFTRFPLESRLGGAEMQTLSLMRGLRERGHEVRFLGSCPVLLRLCREHGIAAQQLDIGPPPVTKWGAISFLWRQLKMSKALLEQFSTLNSQLPIHAVCMLSMSEKLLLTRPLAEKDVKPIWIEHDRIGRWLRWNPWLLHLRHLSRQALTVCVSQLSRRLYLKLGWNEEDTVAVPNGIDEKRLNRKNTSAVRFGLGCVARLTRDKGVDVLVEAISGMPGIRLTIIGDGPEEPSIRAQIGRLQLNDRVALRPAHDDLGAFYRSLDLLILPSREHDPFGLVAAEAMMCGTAVVVTTSCGIADELRNGTNALIVPADDKRALAQAINQLREPEVRAKIAAAGEQTARKKFTLQVMIDRYETLLRD